MNKENQTVARHERMAVAAIMAMAGGYMDIYTYLTRDGVFANAQTGNIVLLGMNLAKGSIQGLFRYSLPIAAFFLGVLLADWIKWRMPQEKSWTWEHLTILLEVLLLFGIGFVGERIPNEVVTVTISFVCAVQAHSFRRVHNLPYASTMCTGNLRSASDHIFQGIHNKAPGEFLKGLKYLEVIFFFIAGAVLGTFMVGVLGNRSIWICCVLLLAVLLVLLKSERRAYQEQ